MDNTLSSELQEFTKRNGIKLGEKYWSCLQEGQRHEIEEGLFSVFESYGEVIYRETGTDPNAYIPDIVALMLHVLEEKNGS
jgi:hypothetical protein